jgi:hypothetical protein
VTHADDISLHQVLEDELEEFAKLWGGPANRKALDAAFNKKNK